MIIVGGVSRYNPVQLPCSITLHKASAETLKGFSYLFKVRGLLNLGKKSFGPSKLEKLDSVQKNRTAILNGL